jgi:glycosyltransferase involved in cell wall biosynthesis
LRVANRIAYKFAHRVLANAPALARLVSSEEGVPPSRVITLQNFVEADAFESPTADQMAALRSRLGLAGPSSVPVIGIVARLHPVKDHETLLRAARVLKDRGRAFRLVIVGDGDRRAMLESLATELGLAAMVHFAGQLPNRPNLNVLFDVSVLCSTSEGFPNSIIEAMAAGRAVVATDVGGIPDAVEHERTGLLVPPRDVEGLANALDRLLNDPPYRQTLGAAGRELARQKYDEHAVVRALEDEYQRLAGRTR